MDLRTYWQTLSPTQKADFATRCDTTPAMVSQVAGGHRRAGESLAIKIDRESGGTVPVESLRDDVDWAYLRGTPALQVAAGNARPEVDLIAEPAIGSAVG